MIRDRIRVALVVAAGLNVTAVAFATERIFDARFPWLLPVAASLLAIVIAIVNPAHRIVLRTLAQAGGAVFVTAVAVWVRDGNLPGDVVGSFVRGLARIVAVRWPAPPEPIAVGGIVLVSAVASAIAAELAWSRRYAAVLLAPPLGLLLLVALLSPKAGPVPLGVVVFVTTASAVVLRLAFIARTQQRHHEMPATERGANALVASVIGLVAILPVAVGAPFGDSERFDPRDLRDEISQVDEEISPLSRLDEWRSLTPPQTFFTVKPAASGSTRWRIVALTRYDGRAWMPSDDFRPIGEKLSSKPRGLPLQRFRVTIDRLKEAWAPFTGEPIETSLTAWVDSSLSGIRLTDRFTAGDAFDISVVDAGQLDEEDLQNTNADLRIDLPEKPVDLVVKEAEISTLANQLVEGARSDYERASFLATALSTRYSLNRDAPAGHSLPQLRLFLSSTKTGRDEQFVAAYALLAQSLNLPVRVAVGVDLESADGESVARSNKVVAWPEVAFQGKGWVAFDPVPEREAQAPVETDAGAGNGPSGAVAPPPPTTVAAPDASTDRPDELTNDSEERSLSVAARFTIVGILLVLAVLAYIASVLTMKRNRRLRRAAAARNDARISGAFMTSLDLAVDLGAESSPSLTNRELVMSSAPVVGAASESFLELANLATRAIYDGEMPNTDVAEHAWVRAAEVNERVARSAGHVRWMRAKLSVRSLRRDALDEASPPKSKRRRRSMS